MINKILNLFKKSKRISPKKQVSPLILSKAEKEAISKTGVIGLGAVWDVYDMWI